VEQYGLPPPTVDDFMVFTFVGFHPGLAVGLIDTPLHQGMGQEFVVRLWTECAFNAVTLYQFDKKSRCIARNCSSQTM
jgi:hypothetical protein